jgi:hypothetical protein
MATQEGEIDHEALLAMALEQDAKKRPDGSSPLGDFVASAHAVQWIQVLAVPRIFLGMKRPVPRDHLLSMVDNFIAYAQSGERYGKAEFEPVPYEQREPLARKLRALVEQWSPPGLPGEITETARAVLRADGMLGPPGGWDNVPDPDMPPEQYLLWPEGVPALVNPQNT